VANPQTEYNLAVQEYREALKAVEMAKDSQGINQINKIQWQLAERSKIDQRRMEEIIDVLVREGLVRRVEAAHAVMYSQN
jgi:hypothetical protein